MCPRPAFPPRPHMVSPVSSLTPPALTRKLGARSFPPLQAPKRHMREKPCRSAGGRVLACQLGRTSLNPVKHVPIGLNSYLYYFGGSFLQL